MQLKTISLCLLKKAFSCFLIMGTLFIFSLSPIQAELQLINGEQGITYRRSLETLRDLDYRMWQVVAFSSNDLGKEVVLRIVGYPGSLRVDHPQVLKVNSGRYEWNLKDITLSNPILASDSRAASAEYELTPLLLDLVNNRPLRMQLIGAFSDLPVPPYLVSEWRSLLD